MGGAAPCRGVLLRHRYSRSGFGALVPKRPRLGHGCRRRRAFTALTSRVRPRPGPAGAHIHACVLCASDGILAVLACLLVDMRPHREGPWTSSVLIHFRAALRCIRSAPNPSEFLSEGLGWCLGPGAENWILACPSIALFDRGRSSTRIPCRQRVKLSVEHRRYILLASIHAHRRELTCRSSPCFTTSAL